MKLVEPTLDLLPRYVAALERGWSPNNVRLEETRREQLAQIERDPSGFVASQVDREARGGPIAMPDGSFKPRLPGYTLWMWDGDVCGAINFRWAPGTSHLPPHVLGHIGYSVVPWMRRRGYATRALALLRPRVRDEGLAWAQLTCDADNVASAKAMAANGAVVIERFTKQPPYAEHPSLRFRWYTGEPLPIEIETPRLRLRQWRDADREPFAALNADPRVMEHFPKCLEREESDAVLERMREGIARRGWGFWALERKADGALLGLTGISAVPDDFPIVPAVEVGWRLAHAAWGQGYATEAARAALRVAFETLELPEVVSFTAAPNQRSAAVMRRLGMREGAPFDHPRLPEGHALRRHRLFRLTS